MLSQSSPSRRVMAGGSDGSGVYKNAGRNQQRSTVGADAWANSVRQIGRDQRRRSPDRGGGLEGEASTCEVEVVAAQGIYVAVVQATRSQSEDEQNRRPMFQEPGQERCGRRFLRIRSVRRHDDFAQLRREASLRELERLEPAEVR